VSDPDVIRPAREVAPLYGPVRKVVEKYEYIAVDKDKNLTQRLLKIKTIKDGTEKTYDKFSTRTIEYDPMAETENEIQ
jgi:hypothetical protein